MADQFNPGQSALTQSLLAHPLYQQPPASASQIQQGLAQALQSYGTDRDISGGIGGLGGLAGMNSNPQANLSGFAQGGGPQGPSGGAVSGLSPEDLQYLSQLFGPS